MQIGWIQLLEFRNYRTLIYWPGATAQPSDRPQRAGQDQPPRGARVPPDRTLVPDVPARRGPPLGARIRPRSPGSSAGPTARRTIRRAACSAPRTAPGRRAGDACQWARVIAFGWQDLEIVNGAPSARRNFIDGFAGRLYPATSPTLVRYRQIAGAAESVCCSHAWQPDCDERLEPWDEQLATTGHGADRSAPARRGGAPDGAGARVTRASRASGHKVEIRLSNRASGRPPSRRASLPALERARREEMRRGVDARRTAS